jgi:hypothetical protein
MHVKRTIRLLYINSLPEDDPSGLKHVEDIKIKKLQYEFEYCAFFWLILYEKLRSIGCTFLRMLGS